MIDPDIRAFAERDGFLTKFENGEEAVGEGYRKGYAAGLESMRAELEWNGIRVEPSNCKMCRTNLSRAKELVEAELVRSAKLIQALVEIGRANLSDRQVQSLNPFVASDAEIARHALAEYEASRD